MRTVNILNSDHHKNAVYPSPFHSRQEQHNQLKEWSRWSDYLSVPAYWCESMEYFSGRNGCGVFDITPMIKHLVTGPGRPSLSQPADDTGRAQDQARPRRLQRLVQ